MAILSKLQRLGMRRGIVGGNSTWMALGVSAWGFRKVQKMAQRETEVLIREELKPGERIIIANGRATIERAESAGVEVKQPKLKTKKKRKGAIETGEDD